MEMNKTKQKILDVSLEMFAHRGFSAVSIRDICKKVNIKESSIYYHFKNKNAIFEELLEKFEYTANKKMQQLNNAINKGFNVEGNIFQNVSEIFFEQYLMDNFCNSFIRLMYIEQFNNEEIREVYNKWLYDEPLTFQSKIFKILMDMGIISSNDSEYMAVKYYSPIFLYFQRYLLSGELTEDNKQQFREKAYNHINKFFIESGVK